VWRCELRRVVAHLLIKTFARFSFEYLVQNAELQSAFEVKQLARRHQLDRFRLTDDAHQTLCAASSRKHAQRDFRQPQYAGALPRDTKISRHRDFQTPADAVTIDRRNHELRRLLQTIERLVGVQTEIVFVSRRHAREHLNIGARTKELLALASDHDHLDRLIHARVENRAIELLHHLIAVRIRRRIIQRNDRDAVACFKIEFLHPCYPWLQTLGLSDSNGTLCRMPSAINPFRNNFITLSARSETLSLPCGSYQL